MKRTITIALMFNMLLISCSTSEKKSNLDNTKYLKNTSRENRFLAIALIDSIYSYHLFESQGLINKTKKDSMVELFLKDFSKLYSTLKEYDSSVVQKYYDEKNHEIYRLNNRWEYDTIENKMGEKIILARVDANEKVYFDFPYSGGSIGSIIIRKKRGDLDIYFSISKGQIDTDIDETYIRVKFDDSKPSTYSMAESDDASTDILFFNSEQSILNRIKKSKKMIVEVPFYQNGVKQFEFEIKNLNW